MGQNAQKFITAQSVHLNQESIQQQIKALFQANSQMTSHICIRPITVIAKNLFFKSSFFKKDGKQEVNPTVLKCIFHPHFFITISSLFNLLMTQFSSICNSSLTIIIPRQKFENCLQIANFSLYFTNFSLLQKVSMINLSLDVHENTKKIMQILQVQKQQLNPKIFDKFPQQTLLKIIDSFTKMITYSINLHHSIISRSTQTLEIIDRLNLTLFLLLSKLSLPILKQMQITEEVHHARVLIGSYFLGYSIEHNVPSIYELANEFLWHQLKMGINTIKNIKVLPSNFFKHLPIVNSTKMINWLIVMLLNSLLQVKQGDNFLNKLNANRKSALLVLNYCVQSLTEKDKQIDHYLQQLCLQTNISNLQRAIVAQIARSYSKIQAVQSQIIKNYADLSQKQFIIKIKNKNKNQAIKTSQLLQYFFNLKNDQNLLIQIERIQCRYITQIIFYKAQVLYDYSDKTLWIQILRQLMPRLPTKVDQLSISSKNLYQQQSMK